MSSRPRRTFATPFVLTLAALPACTATSSSPPQQPTTTTTTTTTTRDHREDEREPTGPDRWGPQPHGEPAHDHRGDRQAPPPVVIGNPPPVQQPPPVVIANPPPPTQTTRPSTSSTTNAGNARPGRVAPTPHPTTPPPKKPTSSFDPDEVRQPLPAGPRQSAPTAKGRSWTLVKRGAICEAYVQVTCPAGATCNPPPPTKYVCPPEMTDKMTVAIEQRDAACWMDPPPIKCPQNAKCATPPAKKVDCPQ